MQVLKKVFLRGIAQASHFAERFWWLIVVGWGAMVYGIIAFVLPGTTSPGLNMYLIQPLLWSYLGILSWLGWQFCLSKRPLITKELAILAALVGGFQIALFILASIFSGFVRSPYGHNPLVLLGNLLYAGAVLVGTEMSRAYLAATLSRSRPWLVLILASLFFSLLSTPLGILKSLQNPASIVPAVGGLILPNFAQNLFASLLAILGGPAASMAYRGVLQAFEWISPLHPNTGWIVNTFLGTVTPVFGFLVTYNRFAAEPGPESGTGLPSETSRSTTAWLMVGGIAIVLLGLKSGVLGIQPFLIASGSMVPEYQIGDIVIIRQVQPESVRLDDVIGYLEHDSIIIHRVVDKQISDDQVTFITRGDANNTEDPPITASSLRGKVILSIPKIGWVAIRIRQMIAWMIL